MLFFISVHYYTGNGSRGHLLVHKPEQGWLGLAFLGFGLGLGWFWFRGWVRQLFGCFLFYFLWEIGILVLSFDLHFALLLEHKLESILLIKIYFLNLPLHISHLDFLLDLAHPLHLLSDKARRGRNIKLL